MKNISRMPYYSTKIPAEQTKADIEKLLKQHGIKDISWTTFKGETRLQFIHYLTVKGAEKGIIFEFRPPDIRIPRRQWNVKQGRYERINAPHEPMAYRLLLWYLKAKLEAVEYGLVSLEKEFMNQMTPLPGGPTVGEVVVKALEEGRLEQLALPGREERKVIEIE